jgi:hypothetical protein
MEQPFASVRLLAQSSNMQPRPECESWNLHVVSQSNMTTGKSQVHLHQMMRETYARKHNWPGDSFTQHVCYKYPKEEIVLKYANVCMLFIYCTMREKKKPPKNRTLDTSRRVWIARSDNGPKKKDVCERKK